MWVTHVCVAGVRAEPRCLVLAWFECCRMPLNVGGGVRAVCGVCGVGGAGRGGCCEGLAFDVSGSAGGGVSVSVNVTICHCNKYPFITCSRAVFECEVPTRVESYFSSENFDGSQGRHSNYWISRHFSFAKGKAGRS